MCKNPYFGGAVYLLLGPVFLGGLAMIFIGSFFFRGTREVHLFTLEYLRKYFTEPELFGRLRRNVFLIVLLTSINFTVFSLFLYRAYHYMESTTFCGQFCHTGHEPGVHRLSERPPFTSHLRGVPYRLRRRLVRQIEDFRRPPAAGSRGRHLSAPDRHSCSRLAPGPRYLREMSSPRTVPRRQAGGEKSLPRRREKQRRPRCSADEDR